MVHVLPVGAVEETELPLAVRGIVGGIDVQQNLAALADLPATEMNELIQERIVQMHQAAR
jgi:predicted HTH domain antitoxin